MPRWVCRSELHSEATSYTSRLHQSRGHSLLPFYPVDLYEFHSSPYLKACSASKAFISFFLPSLKVDLWRACNQAAQQMDSDKFHLWIMSKSNFHGKNLDDNMSLWSLPKQQCASEFMNRIRKVKVVWFQKHQWDKCPSINVPIVSFPSAKHVKFSTEYTIL